MMTTSARRRLCVLRALARGPVEDERPKVRREPRDLARPVADEGRRRDDERRRARRPPPSPGTGGRSSGASSRAPCRRRGCLPCPLPRGAGGRRRLRAGRAQLGAEALRDGGVLRPLAHLAAALDELRRIPPRELRSVFGEDLFERGERAGADGREAASAALVKLDDDAKERDEPVPGDGDVLAGAHAEGEARAPEERPQSLVVGVGLPEEIDHEGNEVDALAADFDPELEAEPVGKLLVGRDLGEPADLFFDDAKRIVAVDRDAPPAACQQEDARGEVAVGVAVAVEPDHVVGHAFGWRGDALEAREVDGAEALESAPGGGLRGDVALEDGEALVRRGEHARGLVRSADLRAAVVEGQRDERGEDLVIGRRQAVRPADHHALGEEANAGDRRGSVGA